MRERGNEATKDLRKEDKFATLRAWVHWVLKNPISEDQELMAKSVNDLFSLLGTREAENKRLREALKDVSERGTGTGGAVCVTTSTLRGIAKAALAAREPLGGGNG